MPYAIGDVDKEIVKWLKKYQSLQPDFQRAVSTISANPKLRPPCKHLKHGLLCNWRIRFRDKWRLIYKIDEAAQKIHLLDIDNRDAVYD
jgi:mRNA-degrading endonuclease RelE of RelBE toxin-antitoxin system